MDDLISRKAAIDAFMTATSDGDKAEWCKWVLEQLPSAQPERLTDDDFETIRIHLSAFKERLCNQRRWEEAEEYQRIIDRFMRFASAQPERKKGEWTKDCACEICGFKPWYERDIHTLSFCPNCGADMRE